MLILTNEDPKEIAIITTNTQNNFSGGMFVKKCQALKTEQIGCNFPVHLRGNRSQSQILFLKTEIYLRIILSTRAHSIGHVVYYD